LHLLRINDAKQQNNDRYSHLPNDESFKVVIVVKKQETFDR